MDIDRLRYVVPVLKAFQGHPEAGKLWETMIVDILCNELGFTSTTHERNLYRGTIDDQLVLICRQVDDFAIATKSTATAEKLVAAINQRVTTTSAGIGVSGASGMTSKYNGLDLHQTRDYIKINCETYISRVLQTHGWETPGVRESDRHDAVPMTAESADRILHLDPGPAEGTPKNDALAAEDGFSFRKVLGELTYAYVLCRPNIGYATTLLSRYSTGPCKEHYVALKQICKYLRGTRDWGIIYWRADPVGSLPAIAIRQPPDLDDSLGTFPLFGLHELVGFIDAAHGNDPRNRRSVTGFVFCYAGGAVAYKSKLQATVATSSTEAEFIAGVHGGKTAK